MVVIHFFNSKRLYKQLSSTTSQQPYVKFRDLNFVCLGVSIVIIKNHLIKIDNKAYYGVIKV